MCRKRLTGLQTICRPALHNVGDWYAEDVVLVIAGKRELRGRQAIFDFYKVVKAQTTRTIQVNRLA